ADCPTRCSSDLEDAGRFLCLGDLVLLRGLLLQRRAPVLDRGDALVEPGRDLAAPALAEGRRVLPLPLRAVGDQHRDLGPDPLQGAGAVAHQLSMLAQLIGVSSQEYCHLDLPRTNPAVRYVTR